MPEEQKAALVKPLRRMLVVQLVMIIPVVVVVSNLAANYEPSTRWLAFGIAAVSLVFLSWLYAVFAFRPLLHGLPSTTERITFSDRFTRQASVFPKAIIVIMLLASLVLCVGGVAVAVHGVRDWTDRAGAASFGILSIYWIALLVVQQ